jgi:glycosyltransferase involved in cell wall biosynthesis
MISQNYGITVVEAMANGLPVIVSDQVGIHHEITRVGAGVLVYRDANEVHQALVQMLDSQSSHVVQGTAQTERLRVCLLPTDLWRGPEE